MFWRIWAITKGVQYNTSGVSVVYIYNCMKVVYTFNTDFKLKEYIKQIKTQCHFLSQ